MCAMLTCFFSDRYADPGDAAAGYTTNVMECPSVVLLCFLYFWNNWSSAVGGSSTEQVLP